jgi:hypothetical protein
VPSDQLDAIAAGLDPIGASFAGAPEAICFAAN